MGELSFLAFGGVTLIGSLLCYVAARFARLSGWAWLTGALRLLGLWLLAAWMGYGTPLYVALAVLPLAVLWSRLRSRFIVLLIVELAVGLFVAWHSQAPLLPINLVALLFVDQCLARLALLQFARQEDSGQNISRALLCLGLIGTVLLGAHFQRAAISKHLASHSLLQTLDLVPMGAGWIWYKARELPQAALPDGIPASVYWQSREPTTGDHCLLSFHGAAPEGFLQGAGQAIALGARANGWRVYSLDHPGFGASPAPFSSGELDAWNPGLQSNLLLQEMRREGCTHVGVIGHSQGVTEALRLFATDTRLAGVWVLGAGLYAEDTAREDYWLARFHSDRGLRSESEQLNKASWKVVRDSYYLNQEYCATTAIGSSYNGKTPLRYVTFEREHENLVATRETLWNCLDYPARSREQLATDHYFDSLSLGGSTRIDKLVLLPRSARGVVAALLPKVGKSATDNP